MTSIQHNSSERNMHLPGETEDQGPLKTPDEHLQDGTWECEPFYYSYGGSSGMAASASGIERSTSTNNGASSGRRIKRGKAYRTVETSEYVAFVSHHGFVYRIGDCVYLESFQPDLPYYVCGIQGFKMTKREQLNVVVKWYYRPSEVPEGVWHTLVQDRHTEHTENGNRTAVLGIKNPTIKQRELFISDATDCYSVSALRGKCRLRHFKDIAQAAASFKAEQDTFFYILGYNPENNRLASIQGEIRVGPSHQAKLPEFRANSDCIPSDDEAERTREELLWMPGKVADSDLMNFLRAARSMAAFAGMCDGGSTEDGCLAAARDATTVNALKMLHEQKYDRTQGLQELVKKPVPQSPDQKWTDEDKKKFVKGLKQWGKNFFKIRKELLPHRTTGECIEFYYLWKKSPMAGNQRPRQRVRRPQTTILRRIRSTATVSNSKPSRPASNEFLDFSSASEKESDAEEVVERDLPGYACHHCYATTSKDWHHAGKDRALLCRDCRLYFKKYGDLRSVNRPSTPPPYLFKPVKDGEGYFGDYVPGVRTRGRSSASKESFAASAASFSLIGGRRRPMTPTAEMESSRKSPSAVSTTSTSSGSSAAESEPIASLVQNGNKKGNRRGKKSKRTRKQAAAEAQRKRRKTSMEEQTGDDEADRESTQSTPSSSSAPSSPKATVEQAIATVTTTCLEAEIPPPDPDPDTNKSAVYEFSDDPLSESLGQFKRQMDEVTAKANDEGKNLPRIVSEMDRQVELLPPTPQAHALSEMPKATTASVIQALQDHVVKKEVEEPTVVEEKENQPEPVEVPAIKEPEPKIDDTIMHALDGEQRKNSKFRRHWYRGESNSCSRTDLIFMVKEGSNFAMFLEKKRVEQRVKHEPKEIRPETRVAQSPKQGPSQSTTNGPPSMVPPHHSGHMHHSASTPSIMTSSSSNINPNAAAFIARLGGVPPQSSMANDLSAVQRLRAYAEAQAQTQSMSGMAPGSPAFIQAAMNDPNLAQRILMGQFGETERQRLEMIGAQERQRYLDEQLRRDFDLAAKTAMGSAMGAPPTPAPSVPPPTPGPPSGGQVPNASQMDPRYWQEFQAKLAAAAAGINPAVLPAGLPPPAGVDPAAMERMMAEHWLKSDERWILERQAMTDPIARMQLEKMIQLVAHATHTHTHTHSHTHLHIHPSANNPSGSAGPQQQPPPVPSMSQQPSVSSAEQAMMQLHAAAAAGSRPQGLTLPTVDAGAVDPRMLMAMQEAARMNQMASMGLVAGGDQLMAERLMQQRQMDMVQRQLMEQRQQALQHNEMMRHYRRLQQEGTAMANLPGVIRPPHP